MINVLFCILRNRFHVRKEEKVYNKVNVPLYEYQSYLKKYSPEGKKGFVYQSVDKIIINDMSTSNSENVFLTGACNEKNDYSYCLCTAFSVIRNFSQKHIADSNYLIILMEDPIKNSDSAFFTEYLAYGQINHNIILVHNGELNTEFKNYITNGKNYSDKRFTSTVTTFEELKKDGSGYKL